MIKKEKKLSSLSGRYVNFSLKINSAWWESTRIPVSNASKFLKQIEESPG